MNPEEIKDTGNEGIDVSICSELNRKMIWMREKRRKLFMRMELKACWNETRWLLRCHESIVNNIPEEYCPPMPLLIYPDYADNLGRRSKMATKVILPSPLKMILNTYYPLPSPSQPRRPSPQCDTPPRRPSAQSPPQQQCSVTRVVTAGKTTVER